MWDWWLQRKNKRSGWVAWFTTTVCAWTGFQKRWYGASWARLFVKAQNVQRSRCAAEWVFLMNSLASNEVLIQRIVSPSADVCSFRATFSGWVCWGGSSSSLETVMLDLDVGLVGSLEGLVSTSGLPEPSSSELRLWSLMLSVISCSFCLSCCSSKSTSSHWGRGEELVGVGGAWLGLEEQRREYVAEKNVVFVFVWVKAGDVMVLLGVSKKEKRMKVCWRLWTEAPNFFFSHYLEEVLQ